MKRIIILSALIALVSAVSCRQDDGPENDNRYFAPAVSFGSDSYTVNPSEGGLDVDVVLSRPASQPLSIGLVVTSSLKEGLQYTAPAPVVEIAKGEDKARIHLALVDDEIWVESSWILLTLKPGQRYTVDPGNNISARINVNKEISLPIFGFEQPQKPVVSNPYLAENLQFEIVCERAPISSQTIVLEFGDLACGEDFLVDGKATPAVEFPAGTTSKTLEINILKKDVSGYDKTVALTIVPEKGEYSVIAGQESVTVHLSDPVVDFSKFLRTSALNDGKGFQIRQGIKTADGSWDGNTTVDMGVSSEGSNYLRNYRNMYDHPSFSCRANSSASQMFRLTDFFPLYVRPNEITILDYGNDQGHREFSPADSLMRFVLDYGETQKGRIYLEKPRSFKAYIGSYSAWQDKSSGVAAWIVDSRTTGGDIDASTHTALTGTVSVTLVKLEGTFDFSNSSEPVLVTAWFESDSESFMKADSVNGKDPAATLGLTKEGSAWKVEYMLWPR